MRQRQQVEILHLRLQKMISPIETKITVLDNQKPNSVIKWMVLTQNVIPQTLGINHAYGVHCYNHIRLKMWRYIFKEKIQIDK